MPDPGDWVICFLPDAPGGPRSTEPLTAADARKISRFWEALGGDPGRMVVDLGPETATVYDPKERTVRFGSDVYPGTGRSPNEAMSMPAAVAHELRHLERHDEGVALDAPELESAEECITSLEATRYLALTSVEKWQLVWDAIQRLSMLGKDARRPITPVTFVAQHLLLGITSWLEERSHGY
jgi:hypothetical protein